MPETLSITFNEIPYNRRSPGSFVEIRPDYTNTALVEFPTRALLFVQKLSVGTALAAEVYRITRGEQAKGLFGSGSVGALMCEAFQKANPFTDVYAIAADDDPANTAQVNTITFTGTASVAGTLALYIAGVRVPVPISTVDTPTTLATATALAITINTNLPVVALAAAGVVTVTAKHKGEVGTQCDFRLNIMYDEITPPGLTVALATTVPGVGNPSVAALITSIAADWFTDWAWAWTGSGTLTALHVELARRYTASVTQDAHGYVAIRGTFSTCTAVGAAYNSPFMTFIGAKASPTPAYMWAAALAGVAAFRLNEDPARQLRGLSLPRILPPWQKDCFIESEKDLLLRAGISTWSVGSDGSVGLDRVITTYQRSSSGVADPAWLDITIPKTLTRIRYDWVSYLALVYPRHKLAQDGAMAAEFSDSVVTPRRMKAAWGGRCRLYERRGWIEDAGRTVEGSVFQISSTDRNRMEAVQTLRIIGNLMVLAAALEFEV